MEPLISIIIPVYKAEAYLDNCMKSVLNQSYRNLEVILVDDGSPDLSGALCDRYAEEDSRVRVIHKKNGGAADARNCGLDVASGEYVAFVDSDDWIERDMYELLLEQICKYDAKLCVCGRYDVINGERVAGLGPERNILLDEKNAYRTLLIERELDSSPCDKLYHKSIFSELRFPVGVINEDAAIIHQIISNAGGVCLLNRRLYYYNHHAGSVTTSAFSEKNLIMKKHAERTVDYILSKYPDLSDEAQAYLAKRYIELCVYIIRADKAVQKAQEATFTELMHKISSAKRLLQTKELVKYFMLRFGVYNVLFPLAKRITVILSRAK